LILEVNYVNKYKDKSADHNMKYANTVKKIKRKGLLVKSFLEVF